jgi:hypothetical protein
MLSKILWSVPANTTENIPDHQKLQITKGTIKQWIIFFDPEAANLLHISIEYHASRILPFSGDRWIEGFFTSAPFQDNIKITDPPFELDIYAYNEDDTYPHEYYVHPVIVREEPVVFPTTTRSYWEKFNRLIHGEI